MKAAAFYAAAFAVKISSNIYEEMDNTSYDILEVIITKSVNYDICKNDFNENEKRKSVVTYVYLLKEVD